MKLAKAYTSAQTLQVSGDSFHFSSERLLHGERSLKSWTNTS
jgi:hypothetical protein